MTTTKGSRSRVWESSLSWSIGPSCRSQVLLNRRRRPELFLKPKWPETRTFTRFEFCLRISGALAFETSDLSGRMLLRRLAAVLCVILLPTVLLIARTNDPPVKYKDPHLPIDVRVDDL